MTDEDNSGAIQRGGGGDVSSRRGSKAIIPTGLCVGEHNCALNNTHRPTRISTHTHMHTQARPLKPLTCASVVLRRSARAPPPPPLPSLPPPHLANNLFFCALYVLYFSPAVTTGQLDRQIGTDISGLCISAVSGGGSFSVCVCVEGMIGQLVLMKKKTD